MKILFILENYYPNIGGVETLFKSLAEQLVKNNHKITILTNQFDSSLSKNENMDGVQITRVPFKNRYLFTFFAWFKAFKLARHHDLIHTTSYNAGIPAFISGLLSRKKVLITFHEVWGKLWFDLPFMSKFSLFFHYMFERFLLLLPFHKFIAVSHSTKTNLIKAGIKEHKIEMIYNGIDYNEFQTMEKRPSEKFVFTYFGRLGISKGLDILINAFALLKDKSNVSLKLILPKQPESFLDTLKKLIQQNDLNEIVTILHELPEKKLKEEIQQSDAVVIPSYSEGFCFTAVETMALKVPIITSGRGALEEVTSGKHLFMKDMSPEGLHACLKKAMNNEWEFKKYNIYKIENTVKSYLSLYENILTRNEVAN